MSAAEQAQDRFGSRHRRHRAYWAFVGHRVSGLLLALFLPVHFLTLAMVMDAARFDAFVAWTHHPLALAAEWGLGVLLILHLGLGLRLLVVELGPWRDRDPTREGWIWPTAGIALLGGIAFLLAATV